MVAMVGSSSSASMMVRAVGVDVPKRRPMVGEEGGRAEPPLVMRV